MTASNRLEREKNFHDNRYGGDDSDRKSVEKYYMANIHMEERYIDIVSKLCIGKKLLEYGCGSGNNSNKWLKLGAKVTGIDISEEGIKKAKKSNCNSKYNADYYVMDAENTEFNKNSFDIVVGSGILHHLDLKKCYQELSRICKDNGHIVFQEPLGHNPFINFFRRLTPIMRTEDEHPMKSKNIKLLKNYFNNVEIEYKEGVYLDVPCDMDSWIVLKSITVSQLPYTERKANAFTGITMNDLVDGVNK